MFKIIWFENRAGERGREIERVRVRKRVISIQNHHIICTLLMMLWKWFIQCYSVCNTPLSHCLSTSAHFLFTWFQLKVWNKKSMNQNRECKKTIFYRLKLHFVMHLKRKPNKKGRWSLCVRKRKIVLKLAKTGERTRIPWIMMNVWVQKYIFSYVPSVWNRISCRHKFNVPFDI